MNHRSFSKAEVLSILALIILSVFIASASFARGNWPEHRGDYQAAFTGVAASGISYTGPGTCSVDPQYIQDNTGWYGCEKLSDAPAQSARRRPPPLYPFGAQTAGDNLDCAGQDESKLTMVAWGACGGTTITFDVLDSNGTDLGPISLQEGLHWFAAVSDIDTIGSIVSAINAGANGLSGIRAIVSGVTAGIVLEEASCQVYLSDSAPGCLTPTTGTQGYTTVIGPWRTRDYRNIGTAAQYVSVFYDVVNGFGAITSGSGNMYVKTVSVNSRVVLAPQNNDKLSVSNNGMETMVMQASDLAVGSCTAGTFKIDNGGAATELCFCQILNTWYCITFTTLAGPVD